MAPYATLPYARASKAHRPTKLNLLNLPVEPPVTCRRAGPRETHLDAGCGDSVSGDRSGFCECGGGRTVLLNGCFLSKVAAVPPFTCADVCSATVF